MIRGCMWDPQVKIKGGIVRVNLDSGMSQLVLVSTRGIGHMVLWPVDLNVENKCV